MIVQFVNLSYKSWFRFNWSRAWSEIENFQSNVFLFPYLAFIYCVHGKDSTWRHKIKQLTRMTPYLSYPLSPSGCCGIRTRVSYKQILYLFHHGLLDQSSSFKNSSVQNYPYFKSCLWRDSVIVTCLDLILQTSYQWWDSNTKPRRLPIGWRIPGLAPFKLTFLF